MPHLTEAASFVNADLIDLPGYALRRASHAMMAELKARLAPIDLRVSEATVLMLLEGQDHLTSSDIGKSLDIQRANMPPLLSRLEDAGLIRRRPLDKKSQAIILTAAGRSRLAKARKITSEFEEHLLSLIPEPHREHFLPALQALTA